MYINCFAMFCYNLLCFPMLFHPGDPVNTVVEGSRMKRQIVRQKHCRFHVGKMLCIRVYMCLYVLYTFVQVWYRCVYVLCKCLYVLYMFLYAFIYLTQVYIGRCMLLYDLYIFIQVYIGLYRFYIGLYTFFHCRIHTCHMLCLLNWC